MKILITGATGYIGSYLTEYLIKKGAAEIVPLCRQLPEYFKDWRNQFDVVECDVLKPESLKAKVSGPVDCIIHLAAFNDVECKEFPNQALMVNAVGTRNMLELACEIGCRSFIYGSTLQVYGQELKGTVDINSPVCCNNDYALTHYIAERYCQ